MQRYILLWSASPRDPDVSLLPLSTTAFAMECGKCSSRQAAMRRSSSVLFVSLKDTTSATVGCVFVSVPVLSKTIYPLPPQPPGITALYGDLVLVCLADCRENGNRMASFNAQEKSTIRIESAFVAFLVRRYVNAVPPREYGTRRSARCSALLSSPDFSFSDSSIIAVIFVTAGSAGLLHKNSKLALLKNRSRIDNGT